MCEVKKDKETRNHLDDELRTDLHLDHFHSHHTR